MTTEQEFLNETRRIVSDYVRAVMNEVAQKWASYDDIEGNASIWQESLPLAETSVAVAVCASGQKAWIAEYGKGSLMDDTDINPYLQDYLNSPDFNPARRSAFGAYLSIVGRPKGSYRDLDGKELYSSGGLEGKNIETWDGEPMMIPLRGKHIIQETLKSLLPLMYADIQEAMAQVIQRLLSRFPKEVKLYRR